MRTASLDLELYDPCTYNGWINPKLETLAGNARRNFIATKGGQVIFCDRVFSSDGSFNIHDKIRQSLCNEGFGQNEIAIVNGFTKSGGLKSDSIIEREVSQTVAAFNKGVYKAIIGSTACIGEGLNLQENSAALHHFDIPFRPSDFIQRNGRIDRQGNSQDRVELHTYMSAGTIDNYSVSLVQRKAGWIDQLLKTKSNVFVNPNDDNYIDADELLLALTEEWGDKTQADERRKEMERVKDEKIAEARQKQRRDNLASLSLLRGSLSSYNGDKGKTAYQNRLRKIAMLEKTLLENQFFTEHDLVKTPVIFLYANDTDLVIRKGDILIHRGKPYEVTALNFQKREFTAKPMWEEVTGNNHEDRNMTESVLRLDRDRPFAWFSQPNRKERKMILSIPTESYYRLTDRDFQKRHYILHLECATYNNDFEPPIFTVSDEGKLEIRERRYYFYNSDNRTKTINPFSDEGMACIKAFSLKGIAWMDVDNWQKLKDYGNLFKDCIPDLAFLLDSLFPEDGYDEGFAESA
jgi:hypothetical protein